MPMTSPRREAAILEAYKRHGSIEAAAFAMSAGKSTVARVARAAGLLKPHARPWVALPSNDELLRMLADLGTRQAVADALGCHRNTIRNRLRRDSAT